MSIPIPGTTKIQHLDENIGSIDIELTPDDLREIDVAASKISVKGDRYPQELEQVVKRQELQWDRFGSPKGKVFKSH